jgi:hypothetical protein
LLTLSQGDKTEDTYTVLLGSTLANCAERETQTLTLTVGGSYELQTSWSWEVEVGRDFGVVGPSIRTTAGMVKSEKWIFQQSAELPILPGRIVSRLCLYLWIEMLSVCRREALPPTSLTPSNQVDFRLANLESVYLTPFEKVVWLMISPGLCRLCPFPQSM